MELGLDVSTSRSVTHVKFSPFLLPLFDTCSVIPSTLCVWSPREQNRCGRDSGPAGRREKKSTMYNVQKHKKNTKNESLMNRWSLNQLDGDDDDAKRKERVGGEAALKIVGHWKIANKSAEISATKISKKGIIHVHCSL